MDRKKLRGFMADVEAFIFIEDAMREADVIFLPGNTYPDMAEEAAALYRQGLAPVVIPSGRWYIGREGFAGPETKREVYDGSYRTECDFLRDVLLKNGVPEEAILCEREATFTYQNAIFTRQLTEARGMDVRRAILCANTIHARRAKMYYQLLYPETEILVRPVPAQGIKRDNWLSRGDYAEAVLSEFGRIGSQFLKITRALSDDGDGEYLL